MKQTPKSCSCFACRRGKGTKTGKFFMKQAERGFRHGNKIALKKGAENFVASPHAGYMD